MLKISLEAARVNAGYTQKGAAALLGVSNKTLAYWEKARNYPPADKLAKMCELYGVSYDNLKILPNNTL